MARIAFVGLGNMGAPMARNLARAGHDVVGFDAFAAARDAFGGSVAATLVEAVSAADVVVTMLPAGAEVAEVVAAVVPALAPGTLLVDCSTIDVATARRLAADAAAKDCAMLDAPVSGGVAGAAAATLTFMVGGPAAAFLRAEPLLRAMGKTVVHTGDAGAGQAAKVCNNMILGISMIAVSEAFNLADALGLDRQKLFDVASTASGQCWALTSYCPVPGPLPTSPANRDYAPGFTAKMMLKDLALAADAAAGTGTATPLGAEARRIYEAFCAAGGDATDFSGVIRHLAAQAEPT